MASLNSLKETLGLRKAKHLLRRATFNYTKEQLELFATLTATQAFDALSKNTVDALQAPFDPQPIENPDGFWTLTSKDPNSFNSQGRKRSHVAAWWFYNALKSNSIKHKLSFFLHTSFTVGKDSGVGAATFFYDHLRLLDFYALGNIKTLATKITLDNGMLDYLDNTQNNKKNPNENYAREYLELFTILKGQQIGEDNYTNYTEVDIQQAAKVFSGFKKQKDRAGNIDPETNIPTGFIEIEQHDTNDKTFSSAFANTTIKGRSTADGIMQELQDFVDMVFAQPETAKAYVRKLYRFFVQSKWNDTVEQDIITPLAQLLITNNYDILPVVKTLLCSEHFFDVGDGNETDNIIGGIIKSPLQLALETITIFNVEIPSPTENPDWYYTRFFQRFLHNAYFRAAGMTLFDPDSVAGYPAYYQEPNFDQIWFSSNTLIGRYKLIESLILGRNAINPNSRIYTLLDTVVYVENNVEADLAKNPNTLVNTIAHLLYPEAIDTDRANYFKQFLLEDSDDFYWTGIWLQYINTKDDVDKLTVKTRLDALIKAMVNAAEFQLM